MKDSIHHGLEGGWRVCESKEHHCGFEQSFGGKKRSFPFVSFFDPNVIVSPSDVHCGEQHASAEMVDDLVYQWGYILVFLGPFVQWMVILYWMKFAIFLLDKEEVCCIWGLGDANRSLV